MPKRCRDPPEEGLEGPEDDVHLIHFKAETCRSINPEEVAHTLFGSKQHLVVLHKGKHENPHWHFQGHTAMTPRALQGYLAELAQQHSKKIASPKARPVKAMKKEVTDVGFQYMMKEGVDSVVTSQGFTPDELEELHELSEEHVASLKNQLYCHLEAHLKFPDEANQHEAKQVHHSARMLAIEHYLEADKMPPPNLQKLVLWHMVRLAVSKSKRPRVYKDYVGERM